jgi:predicted LPLAT superfamily acyltransferase
VPEEIGVSATACEPEPRQGAAANHANEHWVNQPEAGGRFAIRLIGFIALHFGRGFARLFLYPITLYFFFRRGAERRAARDYFRRLRGKPGTAWEVMRLIHSFAATTLDRVFLLAHGMGGFRISVRGAAALRQHLERGHGVLLLGAHVGSFGVLRALAVGKPEYKLKLVMDKQKTPALTQLLEALAPELTGSVIDAAGDPVDIALALSAAMAEGAIVTLLGDRGRPREWMREVPFLGTPAPFPASPWLLAALLKVPVVLCLGLYRGGNRYDLVFETLANRVELPHAERGAAMDAYIGRYTTRLEHYLQTAPFNWFNFYDFWRQPSVASAKAVAPEPVRAA